MTVVFTGHSATILPAAVSALCDSREVAIVASKGIGKEGRNNILVDPRTLSHTEMNVCSGFKKRRFSGKTTATTAFSR
jgi:hypothetical protein